MRLIVDTNVLLFALGKESIPSCVDLISSLATSWPSHSLHIPRTIFLEVRNNSTPVIFRQFIKIINAIGCIEDDALVPCNIGGKYRALGLKPADASIAAYAEFIQADILVSQNRHFLTLHKNLPFRILNAEHCLKLL